MANPTANPMAAMQQLMQTAGMAGKVFLPGTKQYSDATGIGNEMFRSYMPAFVVVPASTQDVVAAVNAARAHNVPLRAKSGGHSYAGYCLVQDGIVVDFSAMRNTAVCKESGRVTVQAGCKWLDVYNALQDVDPALVVLGGQCPSVGVAGFLLGAGLSPWSRSYGLGCDTVQRIELVTADGNIHNLRRDSQADQDLFWATNGGGGGNFGVATEFELDLHRLDPAHPGVVTCGRLQWSPLTKDEPARAFQGAMIGLNDLTDNALAIDAFIGFNDHGEGDDLIGEFTRAVLYNGSMPAYRATIAKIIDGKDPNSMDLKEMHFHDWEKSEIGFDPQKSEISHHHVSFILPKGVISEQFVTDLVMLMKDSPRLGLKGESGKRKNQCHILWDHIGGKTTETAPAATAFYWRGGEFVMTAKVVWSDPRDEAQALEWTTWCKQVLTKYAIDGQAAYINYIDAQLAGWEAAYYGENYPRLQQVKQAVDPDNFFNFPQSIRLPSKKQAASAPGDRPSKKSRS